jgi:fucose permease
VDQRRAAWAAYGYLASIGLVLYAVGALTPYLQEDLGTTAAEAALHPSTLALGVIVAGAFGDRVERRLGRRRSGLAAAAVIAAGGLAVALGPVLAVSLAGAFAMGLGSGAVLAATNLVLARIGGAAAERQLARANAWALIVSIQAPLLIAATASSALGWRAVPILAAMVPVGLELAGGLPVAAAPPRPADAQPGLSVAQARLPRPFWLAWLFVIAVVAIEFAYVVWGSSIVRTRTGVALEMATALAALFLVGMLAGRVALGAGWVGTARFRWWLGAALAVAAAGTCIVLLAVGTTTSAIGLLLAGFGTGTLYPQGIAIALGRAGDAALAAGARLSLASGLAILTVPVALGAIADVVGVVAGWSLVIALCGVAFVLRQSLRA